MCVFACACARAFACMLMCVYYLDKKNRVQASYFTQVTQNLKDDTNIANIWFEIECKLDYSSSSRLLILT